MHSRPETRLLLATRSADKIREVRQILAPSTTAVIVSLDDIAVPPSAAEDVIEVHSTFLENAHAKAAYFLHLTGLPTIAEDSGISVDALDGSPGVYSKRFAQQPGLTGTTLDRANNERLLALLDDVPAGRRAAHYTCAAVFHRSNDRTVAAIGTCHGEILRAPHGSHGFGYDPVFFDPASGRSFGELEPDDKNRRSHRARAFRALAVQVLES